jgi:4-alpha-glucanotransferase
MITHDSMDLFYRMPFGAVSNGTTVILRLKFTDEEIPTECRCNVWQKGYEDEIIMEFKQDIQSFECSFNAISEGAPLFYYFVFLYYDKRMVFYGSAENQTGGIGRIYESDPKSYQVTVYDSSFRTPDWWKEGPVYHIFVDRFNKSGSYADPNPDPAMHHHIDWNESPLYLPHGGRKKYFPDDLFGGNIRGIIEKLDYIESLGVRTLYLSPVFEAHSNHKYDTADYTKIDSGFGNEEIFIELCSKASDLGIKVILDGVFSHTGADSIYFNKYGKYDSVGAYQSPDSPYYSWYTFEEYPDKYDCWWDFTTMPTVNKDNPEYIEFINGKDGIIRKWLSAGASGWRLDVADELPMEFIKNLRLGAKGENPDSLIIGEVWEDASNKVAYEDIRNYCYGNTLDSVMNYPARDAILGFMTGKLTSDEAKAGLDTLLENYPGEFHDAAMNLLGSHDRPRMRTVLSMAPDHEELTREEQAVYKPDDSEFELSMARVKCSSSLLFTMPGVPYIYYGDETGMTGMTDPFNRSTYPWGNENNDLIDFFRFIGNFRRDNEILIKGSTSYLSEGDILGCHRAYKDSHIITLINRSSVETRTFNLVLPCEISFINVHTSEIHQLTDCNLDITLSPLSFTILSSI